MNRRASACRAAGYVAAAVIGAALAGCESGEVLAPTGSTLVMASSATTLSFNGSATITARLADASGRPQDGALVTFTSTLGSVQPPQATTAGGAATAVFNAGGASGTAVITASSGSAGPSGSLSIAIGAAAVSKVVVAANPPTLPFGGGASAITVTVLDAAGNPLSTIPVSFASTKGNLTSSSLKTDVKGVASVTLSTSEPAIVTATAGPAPADSGGSALPTTSGTASVSILPRPQPVVAITASPNAVAQAPTTFTLAATPAAGSNTTIQSVSVAFGDGGRAELGAATGTAIVAQHVYATGGTYTASVSAVDSGGGSASAATVVVVAFAAPLSVTVAVGPVVPTTTGFVVTFTANVTPASAVITRYEWDFGDGSAPQISTGNQIQHFFASMTGPHTVTVTVTPAGGGNNESGFAIIAQ